jgi:hypothetical protein
MVLDHIIPEAAGGLTLEGNLWLACHSCNEFKGVQTRARDTRTGRHVRIFNPRSQRWRDHFTWSPDGTQVIGVTSCGRATIAALQLNHEEVVLARRLWVSVGWWPPKS